MARSNIVPLLAVGGIVGAMVLMGRKKKGGSAAARTEPSEPIDPFDPTDPSSTTDTPRPRPRPKPSPSGGGGGGSTTPSGNGSATPSGGNGAAAMTAQERRRQERQVQLRQLGYTLTPVDGQDNSQYRQAVRAFQSDIAAAKNIYGAAPGLRPPSRMLTKELLERYGPMDVDGMVGDQTRAWLDWAVQYQDQFVEVTLQATGHYPGQVY